MGQREADAHLLQAQLNFDFAASLDVSIAVQRQWSCTIYFYAALHCIQAMAESGKASVRPRGKSRDSHDWDAAWVRLNAPELVPPYRRLREASRWARYRLFYPTAADVAECRAGATAIVQHTARWLEP